MRVILCSTTAAEYNYIRALSVFSNYMTYMETYNRFQEARMVLTSVRLRNCVCDNAKNDINLAIYYFFTLFLHIRLMYGIFTCLVFLTCYLSNIQTQCREYNESLFVTILLSFLLRQSTIFPVKSLHTTQNIRPP